VLALLSGLLGVVAGLFLFTRPIGRRCPSAAKLTFMIKVLLVPAAFDMSD
jgi:hypothetical protein